MINSAHICEWPPPIKMHIYVSTSLYLINFTSYQFCEWPLFYQHAHICSVDNFIWLTCSCLFIPHFDQYAHICSINSFIWLKCSYPYPWMAPLPPTLLWLVSLCLLLLITSMDHILLYLFYWWAPSFNLFTSAMIICWYKLLLINSVNRFGYT